MVCRNLTADYLKIRDTVRGMGLSSRHSDGAMMSEEDPFNRDGGFGSDEDVPWIEWLNQIRGTCERIRTALKLLEDRHHQRLKMRFGKDEAAEDREIEVLTQEIQGLFKSNEAVVAKVVSHAKAAAAKKPDEQKVIQNLQISIVAQISALSKQYKDEQRRFHDAQERLKQTQHRAATMGGVAAEVDSEAEERQQVLQRYMDRGFTPDQIEALEHSDRMVQDRNEALEKIYGGIVDLHEMFADLNALVIDQGTLLDRIDYNIEETKNQVREAGKELDQAHNTAKKSTFKLLIIILLVAIIFMTLMLVLKHIL